MSSSKHSSYNNKSNNSNKNNNKNNNKNRNSNSNNNHKSVLKSFDIAAVDTVILLYLTYLCTFYPLYMHDMYFDITLTRAKCFIYGTAAFIITAVLALALEMILHSAFIYNSGAKGRKNKSTGAISVKGMADYFRVNSETGIRYYEKPWFWAVLFIVSQAAATFINAIMAKKNDTIFKGIKYAVTGERGRRIGLMMMLIIFVMFIIISRGVKSVRCIYPITLLISLYMFYIAYLQHFGTDYRNWRKDIKASQKTVFVSTIGNMNTFGSYLCIFLAISIAVFVFSDKLFYRIMSGIGTFAGAFTIMTAKSDNVYLGTGAALIVLFYVAIRRKRMAEWLLSLLLISSGLFVMSLLDKSKKGNKGHINGIAEIAGNPKVMGVLLAAAAIASIIFVILKLKKYEFYERLQNRRLMAGVTVLGIAAAIIITIIGIKSKNSLFVFNDKWGEYRGYIWKRAWKEYNRSGIMHQLFGYGNETVRDIMLTNCHEEMVEITGKVYDSCHNVILQRLLTGGLFSLVAYLGLFFASLRYMFKYSEGRAEIFACAAGAIAYFAEAMVNPEQPITTPFFFVLLAVGVGMARYRRIKMHNND